MPIMVKAAKLTSVYLRVSTARQDAGSQRLAILEYARREGFPIDDFIGATASARTNAKHRRLDQLMAVLEPGDRLVVSELSRLGRSLGEVVALLDAIAKASVAFIAVKENTRFEGCQVVNAARDALRRKEARRRGERDYAERDALMRAQAAAPGCESSWLRRALDGLSEELRTTVALVLEEGLHHSEVGAVLGVAESTVSWRMHEVRRRLRALAAEDEEDGR